MEKEFLHDKGHSNCKKQLLDLEKISKKSIFLELRKAVLGSFAVVSLNAPKFLTFSANLNRLF